MYSGAEERAARAIDTARREQRDELDLHGFGLKSLPPLPAGLMLRRLNLAGNRLQEVPPSLWQLDRLERLDLGGNRLRRLDAGIGQLSRLIALDLSENRLTALPDELTACTPLAEVNLFDNALSELPGVLLSLPALRVLDLAYNRLRHLPDLGGRLQRLEILDLAGNQLAELPAGIGGLAALRRLDLSANLLASIAPLTTLPALEELFADHNRLAQLPAGLAAMPRLRLLSTRGNPLPIPPEGPVSAGASPPVYPAGGDELRLGWSLRQLVVGGHQPGRRYFEAPDYEFKFALVLDGWPAIERALDLYFKSAAGAPVRMTLPDGTSAGLAQLGRKAALGIAQASGCRELAVRATLQFLPTSNAAEVQRSCEFAEDTMERVADAQLVVRFFDDAGGAGTVPLGADRNVAAPARVASPGIAPQQPEAPQSLAPPAAEPVDAAVFCPPRVACDSVFLVQVFLYPPPAAAAVEAEAQQRDPTASKLGSYSLPLDVPRGTRIDVRLEMPLLAVDEPDAVLVWRGMPTAAQFEVRVPGVAVAPSAIGRVRFAIDGMPVGTLRFQVALTATGTASEPAVIRESQSARYRRAFVSYSSQDRAEVLRRVQAFRIAGMSVFQDILDLDPGERWEKALYREIDNCDVFLLFWSKSAAASEWVGKEIDYALARRGDDVDNPPAIQPVPIEGPPIVPPPPQLSGLHFNDALLAHIAASTIPRAGGDRVV